MNKMKNEKALNTSMCAGIVIFAVCLLVVAFALHWMAGVLIFGVYGWAWAWASKAVKDDMAKKQDKKEDETR